ncbi:hypothetical protein ABFS83_03G067100 [Erythranthe nasuta]
MSGRIYVVILFFWALLTVITPMLVRLSDSANLYRRFDGEEIREGVKLLFPRRVLIAATVSPAAPAPAPAPVASLAEKMYFPVSSAGTMFNRN